MNLIRLIVGEVVGLFVDDEFLAVAIVALVVVAAALAQWSPVPHLWVGLLIVLGCPAVVAASILRGLMRK
jgi:hypothetical protein